MDFSIPWPKGWPESPLWEVDPPRIGACKVTDELLERRWILKWVVLKNREQYLGLELEPCGLQLLCVLERLLRVDDGPFRRATQARTPARVNLDAS